MTIEVEVRRWGNSMAVILPKEFVKERNLKEGERFFMHAVKKVDPKMFGILKRTVSGQEFKDEVRKGSM